MNSDGYDAGTKSVGFRLVWLDGARPSQRNVLEVCSQILQAAAPSEFWEHMRIHSDFPGKDLYGHDAPVALRMSWQRSEINKVNWREFDLANLPRLAEGNPSPRAANAAPASAPPESPLDSPDLVAAYALCQRGDFKGFTAALDKIIERNPRSAEALASRAYVRLLAGNNDQSDPDANRAVELAPNDRRVAVAYYCRGRIAAGGLCRPRLAVRRLIPPNGRGPT